MKKAFGILLTIFLFSTVTAQRIGVYAHSKATGTFMLYSDVNEMIKYYNKVNNTTLNHPLLGAGYKIGGGITMGRIAMGMSQHEHYLATKGKKGELPDGYREFNIKHRSRNAVVGLIRTKESSEHHINIEGGIGRSVVNTGYVYNDGFKSYGQEASLNGSYWVRSFHYGIEYLIQKKYKNKLNVSFGGALNASKPLFLGKYEDQMDYKRFGNTYALYKDTPSSSYMIDDPAYVTAKYAFISIQFGFQYQLDFQE